MTKKKHQKKKDELKPQAVVHVKDEVTQPVVKDENEVVPKKVGQNKQTVKSNSVVHETINKFEISTKTKKEPPKKDLKPVVTSSSFGDIHEQLKKTGVKKSDVKEIKKETDEPDQKQIIRNESFIEIKSEEPKKDSILTMSQDPDVKAQPEKILEKKPDFFDIKEIKQETTEPSEHKASEIKKIHVLKLLDEYKEIKKTEKDGWFEWANVKYNQKSKLTCADALSKALTTGEPVSEILHPGLTNKRLGEIYKEYLEYVELLKKESDTNLTKSFH